MWNHNISAGKSRRCRRLGKRGNKESGFVLAVLGMHKSLRKLGRSVGASRSSESRGVTGTQDRRRCCVAMNADLVMEEQVGTE